MRPPRIAAVLALVTLLTGCGLAGCGGDPNSSPTSTPSATLPAQTPAGARPSSPAKVEILYPLNGSTITGTMVDVKIGLQNAHVVQATSTHIVPTEGHVHLYIDGNLQYMAYTLSQDFPVHPGVYEIYAEFVASDHFPFNPRVFSQKVVFTVK